jgi:GNAT superfamily N-acetyltransferase
LTINNLSIVPASTIEESRLSEFYKTIYPRRANLLRSNWKWLYRSSELSNAIPLVMQHEEKVIAHAGMIPFQIRIGEQTYTACWYVDFSVLPEYQRKGIGIKMTDKWMEYGDMHVTFCNHKSLGIFKKFGWSEGDEAISHLLPLLPGNNREWVRTMRSISNIATRRLLYPYRKHSYPLSSCSVVSADADLLTPFQSAKFAIGAAKNAEYFAWRVLNAPDRERYKVFRSSKTTAGALIKLSEEGNVSVLSLVGSDFAQKVSLVSSIAEWGLQNGCFNLYFLTTDNKLSSLLSSKVGGFVSRPIFAYHSHNKELEQKFASQPKSWERIDSDFDLI